MKTQKIKEFSKNQKLEVLTNKQTKKVVGGSAGGNVAEKLIVVCETNIT